MDRPDAGDVELEAEIPETISTEPALRAFVSGRMDTPRDFELRTRAVNAIRDTSILVDWAFEFTPASPDDAVQTYEHAAHNADILLYLATDTISDAVRREVRIAMRAGSPVVAIDASTHNAEPAIAEFFREIQNDVKYKKLTSDEQLETELTLALRDITIRRFREGRSLSRKFFLGQLYRESLLRITRGFEAAGLDHGIAERLASDTDLGARPELQCPEPLTILEGNVGAGKTLFGERWYGRAIMNALSDPRAPLPCRFKASELQQRSIPETISATTTMLGDWRDNGVALFIDGLDEPGVADPDSIISEARIIARVANHNRVLISSRPSYRFDSTERVVLLPLSEANAIELVRLASPRGMPPFSDLERSLQDTIRSPLFALIYGSLLASEIADALVDRVTLLDALVDRGLGRIEADRASTSAALRTLATSMLNSGSSELDAHFLSRSMRRDILQSRLAREEDNGNLSFSLPALVDWFGSEALRDGDAPLYEILSSDAKAYSWRYPFSVALTKSSPDTGDALLSELFTRRPAAAARVVIESFTQYGRAGAGELPVAEDAARRIEKAYSVVQNALGPLRSFSKREIDGKPYAVRASTSGRSLKVEYLPPGAKQTDYGTGFAFHAVSRVDTRSGWAYRYVLEEARAQLRSVLEERRLWLNEGPEHAEWSWSLAGQYASKDGRVHLRSLQTVLQNLAPDTLLFNRAGTAGALSNLVDEALDRGEESWVGPYPHIALPAEDHLDDSHRDEIVQRCLQILKNALQIHAGLVNTWLPPLIGEALNMQRLQPVHIELILSEGFLNPYNIWTRMRVTPIPYDQASSVTVSRGSWNPAFNDDRQLWDAAHTQRQGLPPVHPYLAYCAVKPFADRPATTIAYDWLRDDLKEIEWLE